MFEAAEMHWLDSRLAATYQDLEALAAETRRRSAAMRPGPDRTTMLAVAQQLATASNDIAIARSLISEES